MKVKEKLWIGVLLTVGIALVGIVSFSEYSLNREIEAYQVRGVLEAYETREKNMPYFKIDGEWISFSYRGTKLKRNCEVGDSLSKDRGSFVVDIFRKVDGQFKKIGEHDLHKK